MDIYHLDDLVKYVSNTNTINEGYIIRYLRNGNLIIKNENMQEKIPFKNVVSNISNINNLIDYTNDLEQKCNDRLLHIQQLEGEIEELFYVSKYTLITVVLFIIVCPFIYYIC